MEWAAILAGKVERAKRVKVIGDVVLKASKNDMLWHNVERKWWCESSSRC